MDGEPTVMTDDSPGPPWFIVGSASSLLAGASPSSTPSGSTLSTDLGHVRPVLADGAAALVADLGHVRAVFAHGGAAFTTDLRHVGTVPAHFGPPFPASFLRFRGRELVRGSLLVRPTTAFSGDLALALRVHRGESLSPLRTFVLLGHTPPGNFIEGCWNGQDIPHRTIV